MNLIDYLPFTISNPGVWVLNVSADMWSNGSNPAITIACGNVSLHAGNNWLINSGGSHLQATAIYGLNRSDVLISGFNIFGLGWKYCVHLENTDGQASGNNTIIDNPRLSCNYRAIRNETPNTRILRNVIRGVGGATWGPPGELYAFGIENFGRDCIIADNTVEEVFGHYGETEIGETVGISLSRYADRTIVRNNVIRNSSKARRSMAVWTGDPQEEIRVLDNVFENYKRAMFGTTQIGMADGNRTFNVGPLPGEVAHDMFDIPGADQWTGDNMGT